MAHNLPPLEPQTQAIVDMLQQVESPPPGEMTVERSRLGLTMMALSMAGPPTEVHEIEDSAIPGPAGDLPIRIYRAGEADAEAPTGAVLYIHGGGFYIGSVHTHDHVCRNICAESGLLVVSVEHRRAPEAKFPAAVDDCYAALCWLAENAGKLGADPDRLAVAGDSSGANLTITTCLMARDKGGPKVAFQVVVYGLLTLEDALDYESRQNFGGGEYFGSIEDLAFVRELYLNDPEDAKNPLVSPVNAPDLSGMPPALVVTAGYDMVCDENRHYASRLLEQGIGVEYKCFETTTHPFFLQTGVLDIAKEAHSLVARRLGEALGT